MIEFTTIQHYMTSHHIGITCIQETQKFTSEYFVSEDGFLWIFSGGTGETTDKSYAGVGFVISPKLRRSVVYFCQLSDRLCALRLRVQGVKIGLISAYAPHSGRDFDERARFFE